VKLRFSVARFLALFALISTDTRRLFSWLNINITCSSVSLYLLHTESYSRAQVARAMADHAALLLKRQLTGEALEAACGSVTAPQLTNVRFTHADLMKNPVDGFSAGLVDDSNLFEWEVTIIGPQETL
jgi:hypothetical protein